MPDLTRTVAGADFDFEELSPVLVEQAQEQAFGRYRLVYQLAFGGMATVYLGRAVGPGGFDRPVAIKRIHPHLATQRRFVEMFLDEARIVSLINHPNVCSVYDFGETQGTYYIAMEYLIGESLASLMGTLIARPEHLRSARWAGFAARLASDACEGLHAAHELRDERGKLQNVVHRDVSPQNLFVTYDGALKVVDFGVAFAEGRLHQTSTGTIKGKLAYMPPEQLAGGAVDRGFDVWALGVCLWEMLAGQRLFRRDNEVDTISAVRSAPILAPSEAGAVDRAPELDAIVLRALSRNPAERFPTARAFGQALSNHVAGSGERVGLADLAEWFAPLVDEHKTQKLHLVEVVRQRVASGDVPTYAAETVLGAARAPETIADSASPKGAFVGAPETASVAAPLLTEPAPSSLTPTYGARPPPPGPRRSWVGPAAIAAASIAALAVGAALSFARRGPPDAETAGTVRLPSAGALHVPEAPGPTVTEPLAAPVPPIATLLDAGPGDEASDPAEHRRSGHGRGRVAQGATGEVNIVTPGTWADVYSGNRLLGRTPRRIRLPAGRRVLRLLAHGQPPERRVTVNVPAGDSTQLVVPMR